MKIYTVRKKYIPTDIEILDAIYNTYYDEFSNHNKERQSRSAKIYVPIDIRAISEELKIEGDIIFGRLYYHLENKYGYTNEDNSKVHFFALKAGEEIHCVNFPYLASILAELRDQQKEYKIATTIAIFSIVISIVSLVVSLFI